MNSATFGSVMYPANGYSRAFRSKSIRRDVYKRQVNEIPKEHILVCLSSSPSNERIVRMAGKMAQAFSGSLTALYVQTPGYADMNAEDTLSLIHIYWRECNSIQ